MATTALRSGSLIRTTDEEHGPSCQLAIITLSLCVYTALHLNIPANKSSNASIISMKIKYVLFGLLAPELNVFNAWRQRSVAVSVVAHLRKERGGKKPIPLLTVHFCVLDHGLG